jgi:hypothetical protein
MLLLYKKMKLQLDTENKTITIEEDVNLHEFYEQINSILPGGLWREFTLKVEKIREWSNPITVTPHTPINPYPQIWYGTSNTDIIGGNNLTLTNGVYNITTTKA